LLSFYLDNGSISIDLLSSSIGYSYFYGLISI